MASKFRKATMALALSTLIAGPLFNIQNVLAAEERPTITWMNMLHTASPPNNVIEELLEEYTKTNLDITWIPDASKEERLTTALASNDLADIVTITLMKNSSVRNAMKSGMFWDVKPYLKDYPNLAKISEDRIKAASIEGKLYGIPFQKAYARGGMTLRKDWLDNLGLEVPKTMDELYEVLRAFTFDDPDGNGKDDTVGLGDRNDLRYSSFKTFASYFGAPNGWKVTDEGKFIPEFETEEYMKTMDFSHRLYKEGILQQDFAVTSKADQDDQFVNGKTGAYTGIVSINGHRNKMAAALGEGNFELIPVNKIDGVGDGNYHIWSEGNGVNGVLAFPVTNVKTEEDLRVLLKFVNDLMDEEAYMLMTGGIEGKHYEFDDEGVYKIIDSDLWGQEVQPYSGSRPNEIDITLKSGYEGKRLSDEMIRENDKFAVMDPSVPLDSATMNERGSELTKIIEDATVQYIMGEIDKDGFQEAVKRWRDQGGTQIISEYEEAYKLSQETE
ncbi:MULTISPECIES: extracellular solute-binding protein [unclassified Facklamia]|uniref:extracellular solute-binding protein n=1 Tax=Aerococcaceae TaxID=186827 RepID=UPI0013BE2426|nr:MULTISPECIES: extracellular solute-binding protein [unclassified Facklamia]MBS4462197.1 extracellular solute-binding protein [Aerococcaceae bacterium zg-B36]NEW64656.1 extracellular solute-binding protein [Facklamia sp. 252]NEW67981.1 extracellular solute-binding protein [Facklamia sp. 253]QQD65468.1 extracellular solute-binding protein [Aerococcaceae bacterium zg-252]